MARVLTIMASIVLLFSACTGSDNDADDTSAGTTANTSSAQGTSTETSDPSAQTDEDADSTGSEEPTTSTTIDPDEDTIPPPPTLEPVGGFCEPAGDVTRPVRFATGTTKATLSNTTEPDQSDLWYIEVGDDQIMVITLTSPGSDTVATLLPPNLLFVPGAFVRTTVAPTDAGVYWICIIAGDTSDRYDLAISVIDDNTPTKIIATWCGSSVNDRGEIRFAAGSTSGQVDDAVIRGERDLYTLDAAAGQTMNGTISAAEGNASLVVRGPSGTDLFQTLGGQASEDTATATVEEFTIELPESGDYELCVGATRGNATYTIDLIID